MLSEPGVHGAGSIRLAIALARAEDSGRLKGAVDRDLGGDFIEKKSEFSIFDIFAENIIL